MEFIDLKCQYKRYEKEIDTAIKEVLESGHYVMGSAITDLEKALAEYVQVKHCVATSSGTDSLLLALKALGIGPGDEVICVPFTWISPIEVVRRLQAVPVFVDIDPETCLMDTTQIEKAISKKTKAIIPVSLYGQMPNFDEILNISKKYNIAIIEDGAQSFGATQNGKYSCGVTTIGVTSFFPTKPLGCYGDGGALFTNRDDIAEKVKALRVHGAVERYNHQYIGMNGRMDTLQAAILLAKLPFFNEELVNRERIGKYYNEHLKNQFSIPKTNKGNRHVYAQYTLQSESRETVLEGLKSEKIPHAIYYPICIHEQPAYLDLGYQKGDFPCAEKVANSVFSLPMHPWISQEEQDKIINTLKTSIL